MKEKLLHTATTSTVIESFYRVYNTLGYGFLEKVYERAMVLDLARLGVHIQVREPVTVWYAGEIVGKFYPDLTIQNAVIVELKAVKELLPEHEVQLVNYLTATALEIGLLLNFGPRPQVKRKIFTNDQKKSLQK